MKLSTVLLWIAIVVIVVLSIANILLISKLSDRQQSSHRDNAIRIDQLQNENKILTETIKSIELIISTQSIPSNGLKGDKGDKGDAGESIQGEKGDKGDKGDSIKGDKGDDGLTPIIRCNIDKNRWEVKYFGGELWKVLNGTPVPCTLSSIIAP